MLNIKISEENNVVQFKKSGKMVLDVPNIKKPSFSC